MFVILYVSGKFFVLTSKWRLVIVSIFNPFCVKNQPEINLKLYVNDVNYIYIYIYNNKRGIKKSSGVKMTTLSFL
jgi:hypothetical protein